MFLGGNEDKLMCHCIILLSPFVKIIIHGNIQQLLWLIGTKLLLREDRLYLISPVMNNKIFSKSD